MKLIQQFKINPIDFIAYFMENLDSNSDKISNLYKAFLSESEEEWYDDPEVLFEENSKIVDGKLKAENFAKMNAKYTSKVIFGYKHEMADKLLEVSESLLTKKFGKEYWLKKEKHIADVINYCTEKSINISDIKNNEVINKSHDFIFDYPKWLKHDNGEGDIQKFNGGIKLNFFLSNEKIKRISKAMEAHHHENINMVHLKLMEVLHTEDLFYDVGYGKISHKEEKLQDKAITSWSLES